MSIHESDKKIMKIIVIAAGSGKRLGKKTKNIPKYLLDVSGKTILEHQLKVFKKTNFEKFVIITGPYKEKFVAKKFTYVEDGDYHKHDMLGSLMVAREHIKGDVLIVYSDIIFDDSIIKQMVETQADIAIAVDLEWKKSYEERTEHTNTEAENVLLDKSFNVLEIRKNITSNQDKIIGEFLGILKLSKKGSSIFVKKFDRLKKSHKNVFHMAPSLEKAYLTDMIQELIDSKIKVTPVLVSGKWCEIDTMQDLERAAKMFQ